MINLSILIPCHNWNLLKLVNDLNQLCIKSKSLNNFEIICIEDGSKKLFKNFKIEQIENAHYSILNKNIGRSAVRNKLARSANFEWLLFIDCDSEIVDDNFIEKKGPHCIIPPNSFVLAKTVEYFRIPKDVLCICVGKSTYARTGIICNVTPIENEFEGNIVIELSNTTPNPAKIYSNEGIAQFLFFKSETQPETTYKSKNGKYQGQTTIQVAKIKK